MDTLFAGLASSARGEYVSEEHRLLSQLVSDYKPTMSVVSIPPNHEAGNIFTFAIVDSPGGVEPYVTRYLRREDLDNPASILEWLFNGDLIKHRPKDVFQRIANQENAERLVQMKRQMEAREERIDFGATVFGGGRNRLHTFRHNGQKYER